MLAQSGTNDCIDHYYNANPLLLLLEGLVSYFQTSQHIMDDNIKIIFTSYKPYLR